MEQNNSQKPKCPTCNRTISKNMERYSITEFYRKVKKITDINSLNTIKDYILRVIKYYYSQDAFNNFTYKLNNSIEEKQDISSIKKWILSYFMNSPSLELRGLAHQRTVSIIKQLEEYIVMEYINNDKDLYVPFSRFYEDFCTSNTNKYSKHSISRALKVLDINITKKKIEDKTQSCLYNSKEELQTLFNNFNNFENE